MDRYARGEAHPASVKEWTDAGERIWHLRVLTYGTKPLPDHLGIVNDFVSESVLHEASDVLASRLIPVRFVSAQTYCEERRRSMEKYGRVMRLYSWDLSPNVRCCFTRHPTERELYDAQGVRPSYETTNTAFGTVPASKTLVRFVVTEWEVEIVGRFPVKEYEIAVTNDDDDDVTLVTGGRRVTEALITYEGNVRPPYRFSVPGKFTLFDESPFLGFRSDVCVRLHDGNGRFLSVDVGKARDLFDYRCLKRQDDPAGTDFVRHE